MPVEIRDAIFGDIVLGDEEAKLLDTYEMQRLRAIRQLGFAHLVYPSANNTRFEHCLGARWLAQKIVRISDLQISKDEERVLYKAALLHDVAEPCFAHVTERLHPKGLPTHEEILKYVLDGTYKEKVIDLGYDYEPPFVCDVLSEPEKDALKDILAKESPSRNFLQELIDGKVDCDSLDYLRRDSFYAGLPYGNYDDRIFASFRIAKRDGEDRIAFKFEAATLNAILSILRARYTLRKAVYLHHAVLIADTMFLTALREALSDTDQAGKIVDEFDLFILGEAELLQKMRKSSRARPIIDQLLSRKLFKRAYIVDSHAPEALMRLIDGISGDVSEMYDFLSHVKNNAGVSESEILPIFHPGLGWKEFDQIVLATDDGSTVLLGDILHEELSLLKDNYRKLWKFILCINREDLESREKVSAACSEYFKYPSEYRPRRPLSQMDEIQSKLSPVLTRLRTEDAPILPVLDTLVSNGRPLSRDEIAKILNLKPSTVSHYLTLLRHHLGSIDQDILRCHKSGRTKLWSLDTQFKEVMKGI